jgi:phosphoenolpyruvate synthase/pyruvate phosphate dikinase
MDDISNTEYSIDSFVCTTNMYEDFITENNIQEYVNSIFNCINLSKRFMLCETGSTIRSYITKCDIPEQFRKDILIWYHTVSKPNTKTDVILTSYNSGMYETHMIVPTIDCIIKSIVHCYASVHSDQAILYNLSSGDTCGFITSSIALIIKPIYY